MSLQLLDALPLILPAWIGGIGMGWGLAVWTARRQRLPTPAAQPTARPHRAPSLAPTPTPGPVTAPVPVAAAVPAADLLVVDDSAVARTKLRRLFEAAGYQVHLANDGIEALALLDKGDYRLLITDLEMPNMDGVTLIHTCLDRPKTARMPILAISGHEGLRAKFNECQDICGIHRKPWVDDILLSHVATLVGARLPRPRPSSALQAAAHGA